MKIVISNVSFDYNIGCRLLKTKNPDVPFKGLEDIWNDIQPMTFKEIAKEIDNIEQRRIAIGCLGIDKLVKEIKPKLIDKQTLKKETTWVNENGELINKKFNDTYELYEVTEKSLGIENGWRKNGKVHYVKCKDTSTDREYLIWVDAESVYRTNDTRKERWYRSGEDYGTKINAIQAVAWTIQTDILVGGIKKIVRQGDCILIKKKPNAEIDTARHLTEKEYKTLLVLES
jgi:hypothetical protein